MNNSSTEFKIRAVLRLMGLNISCFGSKFLVIIILYVIQNDLDFFVLEDLFNMLAIIYGKSSRAIKYDVNSALSHRDRNMSKDNFNKVFNFEYFEDVFKPKIFIDEVACILRNEKNKSS